MNRRVALRIIVAAAAAGLLLGGLASFGCSGHTGGDPSDGGPREGGPGATACQPGSIAGFEPPTFVPARPEPTVCGAFGGEGGLVEGYGAACLGHSANFDSCTSFDAAAYASPDAASAAGCFACLVTAVPGDASGYGAVLQGAVPVVNYPGCVELVDPTEAGAACAQAVFEGFACGEYACRSTCPVVDNNSFLAFYTCAYAAFYGPCQGYFATLQGCLAAEQGDGATPVAQVCFADASAEDHYRGFARYLCGG